MTTPKNLYLDIATMLRPFGPEDPEVMAEDPSFRAAVDHAYRAGWHDREEKLVDDTPASVFVAGDSRVYYIPLLRPTGPPEVYP